jgi:hypothetical protein
MFEVGEIIIAVKDAQYHKRFGHLFKKGDQFTVIGHFSNTSLDYKDDEYSVVEHPIWGKTLLKNENFILLSEIRNQKINSLGI